jgi:hypothetical protein
MRFCKEGFDAVGAQTVVQEKKPHSARCNVRRDQPVVEFVNDLEIRIRGCPHGLVYEIQGTVDHELIQVQILGLSRQYSELIITLDL